MDVHYTVMCVNRRMSQNVLSATLMSARKHPLAPRRRNTMFKQTHNSDSTIVRTAT